ncbi:MAG: glutaredoxin family protein, partial [Gammaproteobacteria bacterium]|nr:glutaredoxin family protein [Gammaproteobacteria bacterium]
MDLYFWRSSQSQIIEVEIKQFTFYYRENCHLCESMRLALVALQKQLDFEWVESDIDRDTDLILLYDTLVPVLQY